MQRNTLLGGLALLAAGGIIGAGAMISSSAMAETPGGAPPADQLTMINVGTDGEAVKCTFSGADLPKMFVGGDAPAELLPADAPKGAVTGSGGINVAIPVELDPNNLPVGVQVSSGSVTVDGSAVSGDTSGITPVPVDAKVLSADDARDGTPEECAAMRDGTVASSGQMVIGTATVAADSATIKP